MNHLKILVVCFGVLFSMFSNVNTFEGRASVETNEDISVEIPPSTFYLSPSVKQPSKGIKISSNNFDITVYPKVSVLDSSSAEVSWEFENIWNIDDMNMENLDIILKIDYRQFGSSLIKRILRSIKYSSNYIIDNLSSSPGYVFCFSVILSGDYLFSNRNRERQLQSTTIPEISTSVTTSPQSTTSTTTPSTTETSSTTTTTTSRITASTTTITDLPRVFINYAHSSRNLTLPPIISPRSKEVPSVLPPSLKRNFAYASNGELILLPSSSWSPFRNKRSVAFIAENGRTSKHMEYESENFCTEIPLNQHSPFILSSPLMILLYLITALILLIIILVLVYLIWRIKARKRSRSRRSKLANESNTSSKSHSDHEDLSVSENPTDDTTGFDEKEDTNSDPFLTNLEDIDFKKESGEEYVFHPGYEIPRSSTMEVYGYDFPKKDTYLSSTPTSALNTGELNKPKWNFPSSSIEHTVINFSEYDNGKQAYLDMNKKLCLSEKYYKGLDAPSKRRNSNFSDSCNESKCHSLNSNFSLSPDDDVVTVSGGTLLENSHGYVVPKSGMKLTDKITIAIKGPQEFL